MKALLALLAVGLALVATVVLLRKPRDGAAPQAAIDTAPPVAEAVAALAARCREASFDPDPAHWSTEYEIRPGVRVVIVPHLQSNRHTMGQLARGQIVAKFVNRGTQSHAALALPGNKESCLVIRSVQGANGIERTSARLIAMDGSMEYTAKRLAIDLHPNDHPTPLGRWYNAGRSLEARAATRVAFRAAAQDSTQGGSGPMAWVTCMTNGCCRISVLEE